MDIHNFLHKGSVIYSLISWFDQMSEKAVREINTFWIQIKFEASAVNLENRTASWESVGFYIALIQLQDTIFFPGSTL